jgi:hypothetical protein
MTTVLTPESIVTYSGRVIEPLNPDPEQISIVDIAHSLSNQCRFTGHTREFYSVAQHSILVSDIVPQRDKLWGLLHDATEAYLSDLARPIKRAVGELAEAYSLAERELLVAIAEKFDLDENYRQYIPDSVKQADNILLKREMFWLMDHKLLTPEEIQEFGFDPDEEYWDCWSPKNANMMFLIRFHELTDTDYDD